MSPLLHVILDWLLIAAVAALLAILHFDKRTF